MMLACPEVCSPHSEQGRVQLGCSPDAISALHPHSPTSAIETYTVPWLLDPANLAMAKVLLQVMVGQAEQARQDAGVLAVQGKLQHALQCINCAIEE